MSANKRERYAKWLMEEKKLLKKLVKPYINTVDSKDFTVNSNRDKQRVWSEITIRFNTANIRVRDEKQLISQWRLMKKRKRMGLSPPLSIETDNDVSGMSQQQYSGDSNGFDTDYMNDMIFIDEMAEDDADFKPETPKSGNKFNYSEASYKDMHHFRVLQNNRLQEEHTIRVRNIEQRHKQIMKNLKLQEDILKRQLETYD